MAEGLNRVILLGNLGADPELRYTQGGQAILKLRLATNETYLDRDNNRQERTEWHSVTLWGKRGEALAKFLSKGDGLLVEGSLRTSSWEANDGQKRYRTEVIARNVVLAGGRGRGGAGGAPGGGGGGAGGGGLSGGEGGGGGGYSGGSGGFSGGGAEGGGPPPDFDEPAAPKGEPAGGGYDGGDFGPDDDDIPF